SKVMRVAVYARVSTLDKRQTSSFELQKNHYLDTINRTPNWTLTKIYADEGISGTSLNHRDSFVEMIEDCKKGIIDLIVVRSVSRFARNIVDCIRLVRELLALPHPVGVFFETEHICTLDPKYEMSLSMIATLAQEESHNKSEVMNVSIDQRFSRGIFIVPVLLGYDHDSDGNLVVNKSEAIIVKLIFNLLMSGCSCTEIAETLTDLNVRTKRGKVKWTDSTIYSILRNERYCGDVLARKTFTPSYLNHKSKKNRQDRNQYLQRDHHEAIIPREEFEAVQNLLPKMRQRCKGYLPELNVISEGPLKGFVLVNPRWPGFRDYDYLNACKSVYSKGESTEEPTEKKFEAYAGDFDLRGYETVRALFYDDASRPAITFSTKKATFSIFITKTLASHDVEMLLHPIKKILIVRSSTAGLRSAVGCTRQKGDRTVPCPIKCEAFLPTLFCLLGWNTDYKYRIVGSKMTISGREALTFDLGSFECLIPRDSMEPFLPTGLTPITDSVGKNVKAYPVQWANFFGGSHYLSQTPLIPRDARHTPFRTESIVKYRDPSISLPPRDETNKRIEDLVTAIKDELSAAETETVSEAETIAEPEGAIN
ncbi:MAG: recombinase family protein, partial [Lachnospiraceae bacterium]|nr:recombinase family protein [Lachnospiraceae bacterium]